MSEEGKIDFYSYIEAEEREAMSWADRFFKNPSSIRATKEVAEGYTGKQPFGRHQKFFPNKWNRLLMLGFMVMVVWGFLRALLEGSFDSWLIPILGFFVVAISMALYENATSKELNFSISVSERNLQVGDLLLDWEDVAATYIVGRPDGENDKLFLLVGLRDGTLHRYELTNLSGWSSIEKKLSAAIEHYRDQYYEKKEREELTS